MARRPGLTGFYVILAVLIAGAGGSLWYMSHARSAAQAMAAAAPLPVTDSGPPPSYVMGSDSAPVVVDDYSDFECPFCAELSILTEPDIRTHYIQTGIVRWRFHDRPLISIHPRTMIAHEAAACAAEQNKFWPMHDQIYFHQSEWVDGRNPEGKLRSYASSLGLDMGRYDQCIKSHRYDARIRASAAQASALGIESTPTLFINGKPFAGHANVYDDLKAAIEKAAAAKTAAR